MALKEEIFDQDSTLFSILDENEVTEIGAIANSVNKVQMELDQYKLQLDGLALRVDQQQARNEEQFVNFNTQILGLKDDVARSDNRITNNSNSITSLETEVGALEETTTEKFDVVYGRVNNLESSYQIIEEKQDEQTEQLTALRNIVTQQQSDIVRLNGNVSQLLDSVKGLESQVNSITSQLTAFDNRIYTLESHGPIVAGRQMILWDFEGNNVSYTTPATDPIMGSANYSNWSGAISGTGLEWYITPAQYWQRPGTVRPRVEAGQTYWVRITNLNTGVVYNKLAYVYMVNS